MGLYGPGGSDIRQRHSRGHSGCRLLGIHARSGGHPLRDAAAKSDTIAVPVGITVRITVPVAVADMRAGWRRTGTVGRWYRRTAG